MASSNVRRRRLLDGDRAAVPAGREDSQQPPQGSRHGQRAAPTLEGPSLPDAPPPRVKAASRRRSPALLRVPIPAAAEPAPTFQLGQHLELGSELAVEVILDAVHLPLVVLHSHADQRTPPGSPFAPNLPRQRRTPLPPAASDAANQRLALQAVLGHWSLGGSGVSVAARSGRVGLCYCLDSQWQVSGLNHWPSWPSVWKCGRGCAGSPDLEKRGSVARTVRPRAFGRKALGRGGRIQGRSAASGALTVRPDCRSAPEWVESWEELAVGVLPNPSARAHARRRLGLLRRAGRG